MDERLPRTFLVDSILIKAKVILKEQQKAGRGEYPTPPQLAYSDVRDTGKAVGEPGGSLWGSPCRLLALTRIALPLLVVDLATILT